MLLATSGVVWSNLALFDQANQHLEPGYRSQRHVNGTDLSPFKVNHVRLMTPQKGREWTAKWWEWYEKRTITKCCPHWKASRLYEKCCRVWFMAVEQTSWQLYRDIIRNMNKAQRQTKQSRAFFFPVGNELDKWFNTMSFLSCCPFIHYFMHTSPIRLILGNNYNAGFMGT